MPLCPCSGFLRLEGHPAPSVCSMTMPAPDISRRAHEPKPPLIGGPRTQQPLRGPGTSAPSRGGSRPWRRCGPCSRWAALTALENVPQACLAQTGLPACDAWRQTQEDV